MSRIGKKPLNVPSGVKIAIKDGTIACEGPKGSLTQSIPQGITVDYNDDVVQVDRQSNERSVRALHGLIRSLIDNMIVGVTDGFNKSLEVIGVGYSAKVQGNTLVLNVGFTNPVNMAIPEGLSVAEPKTSSISMPGVGSVPVTTISVTGIDKQKVGQFAASIRDVRPPEPYKGKGIRYVGEEVRRKAGKAMAGAD